MGLGLFPCGYSLAPPFRYACLRRLSDTLAEYGLETNYVAPLDEVTLNGTPSCMRILDDRYMYMCLWIPNNGKVGLFFRREGNMFVPLSMMDSAFDNTDVVNFLYFAGQPWMVYHINGHGTGFGVEHTYWFNIENGREELFYYDDFLLAGSAGPDCYKMEQYGTLSYTPMEGPEDPYLSLIIRLELEAKYWDIAEGGDLLVAAPEPDLFMGQVKMNLYYDPDTLCPHPVGSDSSCGVERDRVHVAVLFWGRASDAFTVGRLLPAAMGCHILRGRRTITDPPKEAKYEIFRPFPAPVPAPAWGLLGPRNPGTGGPYACCIAYCYAFPRAHGNPGVCGSGMSRPAGRHQRPGT